MTKLVLPKGVVAIFLFFIFVVVAIFIVRIKVRNKERKEIAEEKLADNFKRRKNVVIKCSIEIKNVTQK